ncbi:unnamed protein product [Camellia sinensis]
MEANQDILIVSFGLPTMEAGHTFSFRRASIQLQAQPLMAKMQGFVRAVRSCHETLKLAIIQHSLVRDTTEMNKVFSRCGRVTSSPPAAMHQKGLENTTVADVLMTKGGEKVESWLWCSTDDTVHDAVKQMAQNNKEHKLITVTSNTNILHAMQLMTENHIRHVPVIDENIVGMISVVDVVRAVVEQQSGEVKRLNEFIKGGYSKNL